jgi:hypothetical protein
VPKELYLEVEYRVVIGAESKSKDIKDPGLVIGMDRMRFVGMINLVGGMHPFTQQSTPGYTQMGT